MGDVGAEEDNWVVENFGSVENQKNITVCTHAVSASLSPVSFFGTSQARLRFSVLPLTFLCYLCY